MGQLDSTCIAPPTVEKTCARAADTSSQGLTLVHFNDDLRLNSGIYVVLHLVEGDKTAQLRLMKWTIVSPCQQPLGVPVARHEPAVGPEG
jgi:hypothetical protein